MMLSSYLAACGRLDCHGATLHATLLTFESKNVNVRELRAIENQALAWIQSETH
jgi:hypothetical protein